MTDAVAELDTERLRWMYRQMLRIREFEEWPVGQLRN